MAQLDCLPAADVPPPTDPPAKTGPEAAIFRTTIRHETKATFLREMIARWEINAPDDLIPPRCAENCGNG